MQEGKSIKIICPQSRCRNVVIETAREGPGLLVVRYKMTGIINGHPSVQCKRCGTWVKVPREMI